MAKIEVAVGKLITISCNGIVTMAIATIDPADMCHDECVLSRLGSICEEHCCDSCCRTDGNDIYFKEVKEQYAAKI